MGPNSSQLSQGSDDVLMKFHVSRINEHKKKGGMKGFGDSVAHMLGSTDIVGANLHFSYQWLNRHRRCQFTF